MDEASPCDSELRPDAVGPLGAVPAAAPPASVQPLAPGRYRVQFTASAGLRDNLERLEARRSGLTKAPRKSLLQTETKPASRHIPAAVRRAVHLRDGGRCRFVDEQGRRCTARHALEFHHRHPVAMGGDHSPLGIALACKAHNMYLAEVDYGRAAMARHRPGSTGRSSTEPPGPTRQA